MGCPPSKGGGKQGPTGERDQGNERKAPASNVERFHFPRDPKSIGLRRHCGDPCFLLTALPSCSLVLLFSSFPAFAASGSQGGMNGQKSVLDGVMERTST